MADFDTSNIIRGKFFSLWIDGEKYGYCKTASAEENCNVDDIEVPGGMGNDVLVKSIKGTGSLVFYKTFNGLLQKINDLKKSGKSFVFDLISELNDPNQGGDTERVCIDDCVMTKYKIIDSDITKILEQTMEFAYNPDKVTFE